MENLIEKYQEINSALYEIERSIKLMSIILNWLENFEEELTCHVGGYDSHYALADIIKDSLQSASARIEKQNDELYRLAFEEMKHEVSE